MTAIDKLFSTLKKIYFTLGFQNQASTSIRGKIDNFLHRLLLICRSIKSRHSGTKTSNYLCKEYDGNSKRAHLSPSANSSPKILVIKSDHIGDFIVAIPSFIALRTSWPKGIIDIICSSSLQSIACELGIFDNIYQFDYFPPSEELGKEHLAPLTNDIFRCLSEYDIAIDYRHGGETLPLLKTINANFKAAFLASTPTPWLDIAIPNMEWRADANHPVPLPAKDRLMLLSQAVISFFTPLTLPWPGKNVRKRASLRIGIGLGAGSEARKWGISNAIDLITLLVAEYDDLTVLLFGGPAERTEAAKILAAISQSVPVENHVGANQLSNTGDILVSLDLFIGSDTGLTHFASALQVPTIDIFGGVGNVDIWHSSGLNAITLQSVRPCSPCYIRTADQCVEEMPCILTIAPTEVFLRCKQLLSF